LEDEVPVFLVQFATQEITLFRNKKDGEPMVGRPDRVDSVNYAAVLTLEEAELDNPETGGWKVMELARRAG
jgi:import inner membrane translocase subunit TIM44